MEHFQKLPGLVNLTNTEPFAAWFVVTGDATADGIRVVRFEVRGLGIGVSGFGFVISGLGFKYLLRAVPREDLMRIQL